VLGQRRLLRFGRLPVGPDEPSFVVADNRRLRSATGWNPRFSLEEGLRNTIEWWKRYEASRSCA
jgi:UDP-glucose 4-epimerase